MCGVFVFVLAVTFSVCVKCVLFRLAALCHRSYCCLVPAAFDRSLLCICTVVLIVLPVDVSCDKSIANFRILVRERTTWGVVEMIQGIYCLAGTVCLE